MGSTNIITDVDNGAATGIAVLSTNATSAHGVWQRSLNGGGSWRDLPDLSESQSVVLGESASLRFVPAMDFAGNVELLFRAWDRSSGHLSGAESVDTTLNGGATAFSANTARIVQSVDPINDAPVLSMPTALTTDEDVPLSFLGPVISDVDAMAEVEIELFIDKGTLTLADNTSGDNFRVKATLSALNALMAQGITFTPALNDNGFTAFSATVWDGGSFGSGGNLSSTDLISIAVGAVNDAPTLDTSLFVDNLDMEEDDTDHPGWNLAYLASNTLSAIDDPDLLATGNSFDQLGLAFTDLGTDVDGQWQISLNDGGSWSDVETSGGNALHLRLSGDDRLRFVPSSDANGNLSFTFRAWDRTRAVAGELTPIDGTGTTFAYGTSTHTVNLTVDPINDGPRLSPRTLPQNVLEDTDLVFRLDQGNDLDVQDVDLSGSEVIQLSLSCNSGNLLLARFDGITVLQGGNGTTEMRISGNLSDLDAALDGLVYRPHDNSFGQDQLSMVLNDLGQIGDTELEDEVDLDIFVQAVNDAPVMRNLDGDGATFLENSLFVSFDTSTTFSLKDVDSNNFDGGSLSVEGRLQGTRNDELTILEGSDLDLSGETLIYSGNTIATVTDLSDEQASLLVNFTSTEATREVVELVISSLRYTNPSDDPDNATRSFAITLSDGDGGQDKALVTMAVTPTNDDPVLSLANAEGQVVNEDADPASPLGTLTLSDVDSDDFDGGFVVIEESTIFVRDGEWQWNWPDGYTLVGDQISSDGNLLATITTFDDDTTLLHLDLEDVTTTQVNAMLNSLQFNASEQAPAEDLRQWNLTVADGDGGLSSAVPFSFTVNPINDAPVLPTGTTLNIGSTVEDSESPTIFNVATITTNLGATDVDDDLDLGLWVQQSADLSSSGNWYLRQSNGSWQMIAPSSEGQVVDPLGHLQFVPSLNYYGDPPAHLEVRAWDLSSDRLATSITPTSTGGTSAYSSQTAQLTLTVTAVPEVPTQGETEVQGAKYATRTVLWSEFVAGYEDVDGDSLERVTLNSLPTNGTLTLNGGAVTIGTDISSNDVLIYTPTGTFTGNDQFLWLAGSGNDLATYSSLSAANLNLEILPVTADLSLSATLADENDGTLTVRVELSAASTQTVTLDLETVVTTLAPFSDYLLDTTTFSFPAGTTFLERTFTIIDDLKVEDDESLELNLANPVLADIGIGTVNLTINDNDEAISGDLEEDGLIIDWLSLPWTSEGGSSATFSVALPSEITSNVTITLEESDNEEISLSTTSLTFSPGNATTPQVVTVTGVDDALADGDQNEAVLLEASNGLGRVLEVVNRDDEAMAFSSITPMDRRISEDGGQTIVVIQLTRPPSADVVLTPFFDNALISASADNLLFTPDNWDEPQVLILTGIDNASGEGDRVLPFSWLPAESDVPNIDGLRPPGFDLILEDDDLTNGGVANRPPYRLILEADNLDLTALDRINIDFGAEDPEENEGSMGGIVDAELHILGPHPFEVHRGEVNGSVQLVMPESGLLTFELRARDLLGAITTKELVVRIQPRGQDPFLTIPEVTSATVPYTLNLDWENLVNDPASVSAVFFDRQGDGKVDEAGLDESITAFNTTYGSTGQIQPSITVMMNTGEFFTSTYPLNLRGSGPSLTLTSTTSTGVAPDRSDLSLNLSGTTSTIESVNWNLHPEHGHSDTTTTSTLPWASATPQSRTISAGAFLANGQWIEARTGLHFASPGQPYLTFQDLERGLPIPLIARDHPLVLLPWPPAAEVENLQWILNNNSYGSGDRLSLADSSDDIDATSSLTLAGITSATAGNLSFNINTSFSSSSSDFDRSTSITLPLESGRRIDLEVNDGSSISAPGQSTAQRVLVATLGESGLNMQGVPSHLETLGRDVRFTITSTTAIEEPGHPVELTLAYDDVDQDGLIDNLNIDENQLIPLRFDTQSNRWVEVQAFYTNPDENVVRVKTLHLSDFGLFYPGSRPSPSENSGGGGCLLRD